MGNLLEEIQKCGEVEMTPEETAAICEIPLEELLSRTDCRQAFEKGRLLTKFKVRQAIVKMAKEGVPQMVKIYQEFQRHHFPDAAKMMVDDYDDEIDDVEGTADEWPEEAPNE